MKWRKIVWWTSKVTALALFPFVFVASVLIFIFDALEAYDD